ncbi:Cu(I)/Ag(I) efflux system membrane protein CusB/SilB [Pseudoalteromonas undina]|uniref:Cation efflux system protein n=1 Tax=Pseudoalteromonas undina TaxID=43660 RepID=A0ABN0NM71_9GAMM|nr:efflux RND transporter periplasmic adaptor subunit [Pseudoalteromonas undina]KAF7765222.1 Cu(I)/Ag(I) efflux system membrane protein CusB/SilB [Pseudoalteromonas undina]
MNTNLKLSLAAICSAALTAGVFLSLPTEHAMPTDSKGSSKKEPLYWVAPMDSNYRRDEPGLSPMGMDLVPVYEESDSEANEGPGSIKISPTVINNLGVRTAPVAFAALENEVNTVGYVQYNQDQLIHIHPRVEGWVETLYVKAAGDQVKQDEPLYTLYSPQLVNAQEEFVLALKRNNPVLIRAAKARLKSLNVSDGFISRLQKSQQVLQNITFYARQGGVVDELNIREGFYVKPDTSMMSIAQLDEVWVEAEVFERQAGLIHVGLPVTMTLDYLSGQRWEGQVDYIYPTLDAKNRTLRVRLRFDNQGHQLKPNMFAQVSIHSQVAEKQLIVPKEAVIRTGSQNRVVVALGEGRFKSVEVTLGRSDAANTEILSGVMADDEVVTSAQFLIDSESSKNSDFKRMQAVSHNSMQMSDANPNTATVNGVINSIDANNRVVNISREAIEKWGRGPATMDFMLAKNVMIEMLKLNDEVTFTFSIEQGEFVIHTITPVHATHSQHH